MKQACCIATVDFFSVVVPIYLVSDRYFVKSFFGSVLRDKKRAQLTSDSDEKGIGLLEPANIQESRDSLVPINASVVGLMISKELVFDTGFLK